MPRKTLQQRQRKITTDTDSQYNRIREVLRNITGKESADDLMIELLGVLQETGKIPTPGKFYIFVYNAKTPNIRYDQNPLVAVTDVFRWGFRGFNMHWGETRQYTWNEVVGSLYEVYPSEIKDLQAIPFANFRINT